MATSHSRALYKEQNCPFSKIPSQTASVASRSAFPNKDGRAQGSLCVSGTCVDGTPHSSVLGPPKGLGRLLLKEKSKLSDRPWSASSAHYKKARWRSVGWASPAALRKRQAVCACCGRIGVFCFAVFFLLRKPVLLLHSKEHLPNAGRSPSSPSAELEEHNNLKNLSL